jgi:protein O-mannosyl-transferase
MIAPEVAAPESAPARGPLPTVGWGPPLLLVAIAMLAYANCFRGAFVFDDVGSILENPSLRHWSSVFSPPAHGETVTGRPMLNATFALNHAFGGEAVFGYHATNLLIHICTGLLLFGVVRRTLARIGSVDWRANVAPAEGAGARASRLALLIAALWLAHPLQTESVTYIVQRAESLMGLFYLATLYAFIRGTDFDARPGGPSLGGLNCWLGLSVLACLLGMGTKEVMVSAPVIVAGYDRTFVSGSFVAAWRRRRGYYLALAATWLVLVLQIIATGGDRGGSTGGLHADQAWLPHAITQFHSILTYLRLVVWPFPQAFDYEPTWPSRIMEVLMPGAAVAGLIAAIAVALWRNTPVGFAGAWFFAILAPTSLVPAPTQFIAEHRMYLALAPVLVVAVATVARLTARRAVTAGGIVVLAFVALAAHRNQAYRSALALWHDTVFRRPLHGMAHLYLADSLRGENRIAEALSEYQQAIWLSPNAIAFNSYGSLLTLVGRAPEALPLLESAVTSRPKDPEYRYNLGLALARTGHMEDAVTQFETAVALRPEYDVAENNLGNALLTLRRPEEAARHFAAALRINPLNSDAHYNLGTIWLQSRRWDAAARELQRATVLAPNDPDAHAMLGRAWEALGNLAGAEAEYRAAVKLNPAHPAALPALQRMQAPSRPR